MNSWVSSAFTDSSIGTIKNTRSKNLSQKSASQKQSLSNLTNKELRNKITEPFNSPAKRKTENSISLSTRYEPQTRSELSVHKNKVEQLSNILDDCLNKSKGSIILIDGPSGCGKYVTLKVLCKEKDIQLVEWDQNFLNLKSFDLQSEDSFKAPYESQLKNFTQFLFKSSRYESDQLFDQKISNASKKLLLVKEIPSFVFKDIHVFQNLLQDFKRFSKFSLIFTFTSTNSSDLNPHRIFTADIRKNLRLLEISFNPIANTYLSKKHINYFAFKKRKFF